MDSVLYVELIKKYVRDTALSDTIEFIKKPPGRKPRKKHVEISKWFNSLSEEDKQVVARMMLEAIDSSLYRFFSVLDGVRFIEDTEEKSKFELYCNRNGDMTRLNPENEEPLHDVYNQITNSVD